MPADESSPKGHPPRHTRRWLAPAFFLLLFWASCTAAVAWFVFHPDPEYLPISTIAAMYHENAARAEMRFRDRPIYFEMRVDRVGTSYGKRVIVVEEGRQGEQFGAIFPEEYTPALAKIRTGRAIRGHGRLSHTAGGVTLSDCVLDD